MNDCSMIIEPGTLRIQRLLPGPIEQVWVYLTESDKQRHLAGGRRHDVGKRRAAGAGVSQLRSGGRARTTAGQGTNSTAAASATAATSPACSRRAC